MNRAEETAKILLETQSIQFSPNKPFTLTSGRISPVYVDCRKLIAFVDERRKIIQMWKEMLQEKTPDMPFDVIAGGETAGIPYGALLSETLDKPMAYIRKKPKGFGRNAGVEGNLQENQRVLLVEDLATDGGSKVTFVKTIREAQATVAHCVVVFEYGIFKDKTSALEEAGVQLHSLAMWSDVIAYARANETFSPEVIDQVQEYLNAPNDWTPSNQMQLQEFK